ncbi:MAG: amidohydrolase [Alkalibacterium sp.]|nr:amidohydrolase [Alkalibacterium sp.]
MKWFKNGKIYLKNNKFAESMIVKDNRILKIGDDHTLSFAFTEGEMIDLEGKTVIPGLIDSHLHFLMTAEFLSLLPITGVSSMKELIERCRDYIVEKKMCKEEILYSEGWNHTLFTDEKRMPNRRDLDQASMTVPIVLVRVDRHVMSLNTAALRYFNITKESKVEGGGAILKDEQGEPTGILTERALDLVKAHLPNVTSEEKKRLLKETMSLANRFGITSMHTNDAKDESIEETLALYSELEDEQALTVRFYQQIWFNDGKYLPEFLTRGFSFRKGTDWNRIGPIKFFIDGTLGSRTAALREPYSDEQSTKGIMTKSEETLTNEVKLAVDNGFQVITHGIGDQGIETILNAYDSALGELSNTLRLGINHMQITGLDLIDRVAEKDYLTYVQPVFLEDDLPILYDRVGPERAETSYLFNTMKKKGIHQSFSSDAPVVSFNPFDSIQCAVTRNRLTDPMSDPFLPEEAMTIYDAIDAYTFEGAYASFDEDKKGRIKEGYLADFAILNQDIFTTDPSKIKHTTIQSTYVNGKRVYSEEMV